MRLLVTGGAGFIGSNFIRYMLRKYPACKIINLDKLTYAGNPENLRDLSSNKNYSFVKGDICDSKLVEKLIDRRDCVINFAAATHVDRSIKEPLDFVKTNVFGTYVLLEACRKAKPKLFLQVSTDEIYGSILKGRAKETACLLPNSPYAATKAAGDCLVRSYFITYGVPVIISRSTNNFGPYQYPEKVIPLFITNLLENKKVPLYGDGLNRRDWIYVIDNCKAIDAILRKGNIGETYNIAGGNEIANVVLTNKILRLMKKGNSFIEYVKDRLGHDRRYALDCAKLKSLGWRPEFSFDKALALTADWYGNNPDWWKKLKKPF
jgi:dTDP-glucose 4,6-dehydratase